MRVDDLEIIDGKELLVRIHLSLSCTISEPDDGDDAELMVQLVNQAVEILPQWEFGARQLIKRK